MISFATGDIFTLSPPRQTLKAWSPFWDCVDVLFHFQNSDVADGNEEYTEWRLYWVAGMALLRTTGHVLAKVDARSSPRHGTIVQDRWRHWKENRDEAWIFFEFIEQERNNILKTYSFGARFVIEEGRAPIRYDNGVDAFFLFREAVYWWRHELMLIEGRVDNP